MNEQNLEQIKELIERIADSYDLPTDEQVAEMRQLTGNEWESEDLQMICCEYWSHNSIDETAYMMLHETYPPVSEIELAFWRYKPGAVLNDEDVYEKYRLGGVLKALEPLPLEEIILEIKASVPDWSEDQENRKERLSYTFISHEQMEYWRNTHFWIFPYSTKTDFRQMITISCHNMTEQQIARIIEIMEKMKCPLHFRKERNTY